MFKKGFWYYWWLKKNLKYAFVIKQNRSSSSTSLYLWLWQVFCFCFVCQVFNGYEGTSNYMLCWSSESITVVYVRGFLHCGCLYSIALCEFVIYSGCNIQSCFSIIINTETVVTSLADFPHYAHLFRQIGIFPAIYVHLNFFGWSGTIGS